MTDSEVGTEVRQIYIEMTKPSSWFAPLSILIRLLQWKWWTKQKWRDVPSHTRVKFFDKYHGVWWIYEASGSQLKYLGDNKYTPKVDIVAQYEFYITRDSKKRAVVWVNQTTGMKYGKLQLVGLGLVKLFKYFGFKISNPFADGVKRAVCTETVFRFLEHFDAFQEKLAQYEPDSVDLCDIMDILEEVL